MNAAIVESLIYQYWDVPSEEPHVRDFARRFARDIKNGVNDIALEQSLGLFQTNRMQLEFTQYENRALIRQARALATS